MKLKAVNIVLVNIIALSFLPIRDLVGGCKPSGRRRGGGTGSCKPIKCKLGQWSSWSACSHSCGSSGTKTRSRYKTEAESCGGTCEDLRQITECNRYACQNGGSPIPGRCRCTTGWTGTCCESGR